MNKNNRYFYMSRWCILLIFVATLLGVLPQVTIVYISVAVHECAHLAVCRALGVPTEHMRVLPYGMELKLRHLVHPLLHIAICAAGPMANLVLFCAGRTALVFFQDGYVAFFTGANFILFVFNLFPCVPMDGGEILRCIFSFRVGVLNSYRIISAVSYICGSVLFVSGGIFAYYTRGNVTMLIVALPVFVNIAGLRVTYIYAVRDVLAGEVSHPFRIKLFSMGESDGVTKLIRRVSFRYTMVVAVRMEDGRIHILSQSELIDAVNHKNTFATLGECVEFSKNILYNNYI